MGDYYQWVFLGDASIPVPATAGSAAADAEGTAQHGRQQPARPPGTARSAGGRKRKLGSGAPEQAQQRGKQGLEQQQQPAAVEAAEAGAAGTASGHAAGAAAAAADAAMADAAPPAEDAQGAAAAAAGGGIESGVQLAAAAAEQQGDGSESAGAPMEAEGAEPAEEAGCKQASGAADAGCAAVAAPEGPAAAEAAPAGAAAQAALAGGGEAGAAGVSEAPHAAERQPEAVAAAPPLETAGSPAGLPEAVAGGTTAGVAPAAEGPPAFDPRAPWLLAVKLEGPAESINWLDPASDEGVVVAFRDLVLTGSDASVRLWNARGSLRTEIARCVLCVYVCVHWMAMRGWKAVGWQRCRPHARWCVRAAILQHIDFLLAGSANWSACYMPSHPARFAIALPPVPALYLTRKHRPLPLLQGARWWHGIPRRPARGG